MKKFRLYFDKDKEEVWINEMCQKGYAMKSFFLGVYTFNPCGLGEYTYRIDLLQNWEGYKKDYVSFMEEVDVEFISQWYRWVYLRKKVKDGAFELYSDTESKVQHYKRIRRFFLIGMFIELFCFLIELQFALITRSPFITGIAIFAFAIAILFLNITVTFNKRIKKYK